MAFQLKQFGRKAYNFIKTHPSDDAKLTILDGSVRSGKTVAMIPKLLALNRYQVEGKRLITGASKQAIKNNILDDLFDVVGKRNYHYNRQNGELLLYDKEWVVMGAKDEGSERFLRGMTVGIAYGDELTLLPGSFFRMLQTRLSPEGARMYGTTNPDNPYHYLNVDYLQNKELIRTGQVRRIHFTMRDNPHLTADYKAALRMQFTGVFYLRFILGMWVIAEGAIYRDCWPKAKKYDDHTRPIWLKGAGGAESRVVSIDYGTTNPTVFLDIYGTGGNQLYLDQEYYWDSKKEMRQKTDGEYADDLEIFCGEQPWPEIVLDPAAASFAAELRGRGFYVTDALNDVMDGIRRTSAVINLGWLNYHESCENFEREMQTYAWNEKRALKAGEEEPIKLKDHAPDAFRYYVYTMIPDWRLLT